MTDDANDFLMRGGVRSFPFNNMGDRVDGEILDMKRQQQTNMDDGKPSYWDNGDPKFMLVITLQTQLRDDDDDDGQRALYCRGGKYDIAKGKGQSMQLAIREAVRASGAGTITGGGKLTVQYSGEAPAKGKFNPAKLYTAQYTAPVHAISVDDL